MRGRELPVALLHGFAALFLVLATGAASAQEPATGLQPPETLRLMLTVDSSPTEVIAQLYKPAGPGPFPLVLFAHGRAGSPRERAALAQPIGLAHANYWLRKGVAVLAPVRPGYGDTGGRDREDSMSLWRDGQCLGVPAYERTATNARATQAAALAWAQQQPWVRRDRILLEGQSVGGLTTIALATFNTPGVVGAVNFAGGAGGNPKDSPGQSCQPDRLTEVYRLYGRATKMPTLWLYAANDAYWGPAAPVLWHEAFKAGGSNTQLVLTDAVEGADGHQLINRGARLWRARLDDFVRKVGLLTP
ncbi:MAG: dipeptidyl aminopeptidase [Comamonadaceae bacterium]|nr:MAG: dipeptidyl aminopeptidase [Comamonadaceae bacterium]